jgi:hypothetical protein
MTVYQADPSNVLDVIWNAVGGDTVQLASGQYKDGLPIWNQHKDGEVVIERAPGAEPVVAWVNTNNSSNFTLRDFDIQVDPAIGMGVQCWDFTVRNILMERLRITGPSQTELSCSGISMRNLSADCGVVVRDCDLSYLWSGVFTLVVDGVTIQRVKLRHIAVDGIIASGAQNTLIEDIDAADFFPTDGAHPDVVQFYNGEGTPCRKLTIRRVYYERGIGGITQGIFGEDGEEVVIEDNVLYGTMYNGIGISRTKGFKINRNFLQALTLPDDTGTRIIVRGDAANGEVIGNATPAMIIGVSGEPQPINVVVEDTTYTTPAAPGDYSQYEAWKGEAPIPPDPGNPCADWIEQVQELTQANEELTQENAELVEENEALAADLELVTAQRDAAVVNIQEAIVVLSRPLPAGDEGNSQGGGQGKPPKPPKPDKPGKPHHAH